ncbi:hypothetical protein K438DRAFT_1865640 [Mycena galopus ATCC 62051]|nr:hypothetical protein K438DRAFT_1865640 [Mycena galopus ATCC 62051]
MQHYTMLPPYPCRHFPCQMQLQEVFTDLEAEIICLWEDTVLVGLDLLVEWSEIVDNLMQKQVGYSFLQDK